MHSVSVLMRVRQGERRASAERHGAGAESIKQSAFGGKKSETSVGNRENQRQTIKNSKALIERITVGAVLVFGLKMKGLSVSLLDLESYLRRL